MAYLYVALRWYVNYFQPSFQLIDKTRDDSTTVKHYSQPATPCDRLIQHDATGAEMKASLDEYRIGPDPVLLLHTIREAQSALVATTSPEVRETPWGESLERFLAKLPSLWRQGEVRPTHAARVRAPRHWRTRKDPALPQQNRYPTQVVASNKMLPESRIYVMTVGRTRLRKHCGKVNGRVANEVCHGRIGDVCPPASCPTTGRRNRYGCGLPDCGIGAR